MKIICFGFLLLLSLAFTPLTKAQSQSNFAGNWIIDKKKTKLDDLPKTLKNYSLVIVDMDKQIGIKHVVEGEIEPHVGGNKGLGQGSGKRVDFIHGEENSDPNSVAKPNFEGSLALSKTFTPPQVVYELDGKEKTYELKQNNAVVGWAKVTAKAEKSGKAIRTTTVRKMKTSKTEMTAYIRERWDISDDGKTLKYIKTVELPVSTDEVILYFNRTE